MAELQNKVSNNFFNPVFWGKALNDLPANSSNEDLMKFIKHANERAIELLKYWSTLNNEQQQSLKGDYHCELSALLAFQYKCINKSIDSSSVGNEAAGGMDVDGSKIEIPASTISQQIIDEVIRALTTKDIGVQSDLGENSIAMGNIVQQFKKAGITTKNDSEKIVAQSFPYEQLNNCFTKFWSIRPMAIVNKKHICEFMRELVESTAMAKRRFPNAILPEDIIVSSVHSRLDIPSRVMFSRDLQLGKLPKITSMIEFLEYRMNNIQPYEGFAIPPTKKAKVLEKPESVAIPSTSQSASSQQGDANPNCVHCRNSHHVSQCEQFKTSIFNARRNTVSKAKLCWNCLKPGHITKECTEKPCEKCSQKHHILLCRKTEDSN